ncbi:MAG: sugar-binding protein, partial [Verrucomicrobiota bacterium]
GNVLEGDAVEFAFDTNRDKRSFHHFAMNPGGVFYDAKEKNAAWNSSAKTAVGKDENAWTVEIAIPLDEIGADFSSQKAWGFQMARHRPKLDERKSYQWSPTFWFGNTLPTYFGTLKFN